MASRSYAETLRTLDNRLHATRRVERPPYDRLRREIAESSYAAVGRRYGVSDNAIRKWVRSYEREEEAV
jgi:transposase-like protein